MSIPGKLLIALLSAFAVSFVAGEFIDVTTMKALFTTTAVASVLAVVLSHKALPMPGSMDSTNTTTPRQANSDAPARGNRSAERPAQKTERRSKKRPERSPEPAQRAQPTSAPASSQAGDLEAGQVKWFNGSKGFGFLIRDNGEEVFVHHRSIVGEGRRNLNDGAAVRFRVVNTDKGPQAEDVEPQE